MSTKTQSHLMQKSQPKPGKIAMKNTVKSPNQQGVPDLRYLVLAWALPGLGHLFMGDTKRGLILCFTICSLFLSGLLIGGVGVVDYKLNRAWFLGQMFNGPAVLLAVVREKTLMASPHANISDKTYFGTPDSPNAFAPSFGRPNEIGILYTALAGLLNLFIFYDVLERSRFKNGAQAKNEMTGDPS